MKEIDCRGLACPQPVLNTKDALEGMESGQLAVVVDNAAARDNVTRFATSQKCTVDVAEQGQVFKLTITKGSASAEASDENIGASAAPAGHPRLVVKVANRFMGDGSDDLGRVLMTAFLKSLSDASVQPEALVFYNSGVYLACRDSEHLEALRALEEKGVKILSCGTCLDFFKMKDRLAVGLITNMFEIIETLSNADRVVSP